MLRKWDFYLGLGIGLLILFYRTGGYWSATWLCKWAVMMLLGSVAFSVWACKRTSFFHLPLLLYVFAHLIMLSAWPQPPYHEELDSITLLALQKNAFSGVLQFATCVGFAAFFARSTPAFFRGSLHSLGAIWLVGIVANLFLPRTGPYSPPNNGLWFGNPSMEGCLLACLLPFALDNFAQITWKITLKQAIATLSSAWLLTFFMIYRTGASVPWGVLGVVTACIILLMPCLNLSKGIRRYFLPLGAIGVLAGLMILLGQRLLGYEFWNQNGRFEIWSMAWDWFKQHGSAAFGLGYSTSQVFLPLEQLSTGAMKGQTFLWLHNDWLQLAIEGGYVGMVCVLLSLARLLPLAWESSALFSSLVGFITMGLMNYPLRMPIHCYALAVIIGACERLSGSNPNRRPSQRNT